MSRDSMFEGRGRDVAIRVVDAFRTSDSKNDGDALDEGLKSGSIVFVKFLGVKVYLKTEDALEMIAGKEV